MQVRIGTISAMNLAGGTVDVKFSGQVSTGLWLLDSVRTDTLAVGASVACLFPQGAGEGVCLGRHYSQIYQPPSVISIDKNVNITGELNVSGNTNVSGNISAANFP